MCDSSLLGLTAAEHGAQYQQLAAASVLDRHGRRHLAGSPHREVLPPQCDRKWGNNDARLVYLDLGVNWANTLRLYRDIGVCSPDDPRWEIYGFEAMPLLHPYVNQVTNWLNGLQERPPMELPPAGSSADLGLFAKHFDCHNVPPFRKGYCLSGCKRCMAEKLHDKLGNLTVDPELEERRRVDAALALAARPNAPTTGRPRYAFVPAAVGVKDATMTLAVSRFQLLHGGAHPPDPKHYPATLKGLFLQEDFSVNSVNVVEWMVANFQRKDWVVVKMDIEGSEYSVLPSMLRSRAVLLVDELMLEIHYNRNSWKHADRRAFCSGESITSSSESREVS